MKLSNICKYRNEKICVNEIKETDYISTDNMLPNFTGIGELKSFPKVEKVNKYCKNDILLSNIRPYFKKMILADKESGCSSDILVMQIIDKNVNPTFLYYKLRNNDFFDYVVLTSKGTKMPRGDKVAIMNYELEIPSIGIQNKIVKVLENIDNKIKLNNQINDNLYELAIGYLGEKSKKDEVPINNFAKIQGGYAFKSNDLIDESTSNRVIKIKNLRNEISADVLNSQFVKDNIVNKIDKKFKLDEGDVIIAMTGAELGKTGFIYGNDNYYLNQRVGVIRGHNEKKEIYLKILFLSDDFQMLLNSKGYGSAQPNISTTDIENILVKDINEDSLNDFYKNIKPIYDSIISNCKEILVLGQLRDTLLPELMNGEIDLENVEI